MFKSHLFLPFLTLLSCLAANNQLVAQNALPDKAFAIYDATGEELNFAEAVEAMARYDVVLFGEYHDHALIHWLQLKTVQALAEKKKIVLGGEMFETDGQLILDEYLMNMMTEKVFEDHARLWPNYKTDYKPLVDFAKANAIPFIATNVPRRYASLVARHGLDTLAQLSAASRVLLPSLPIEFSMETPGYEDMIEMMQGGHGMPFSPENFVKAQAIKDATMAERIAANLEPKRTFIHFNGDFHSADYGGIYWYLKQAKPDMKVITVKIFSENSLDYQEDWQGSGDLILVVPADFTRTH